MVLEVVLNLPGRDETAKSSKLTNGDAMKYEQVHLSHSYCIAQKSKRARSVTFGLSAECSLCFVRLPAGISWNLAFDLRNLARSH